MGGGAIDASKTKAEEADLQRQGGWPMEPEMKRREGEKKQKKKKKKKKREGLARELPKLICS